jgi:hypothetical protein
METPWLMVSENGWRIQLVDGFGKWMENPALGLHMALPVMVYWALWTTRNVILFKGKPSPLEVFHSIKYIYNDIKQPPKQKDQRPNDPPVIDKSYSWGYLDGASQGNPGSCGAGGVLFISDPSLGLRMALPVMVSWALWTTRNGILFKGKPSPLEVFHSIKYIYNDIKQPPKQKDPRPNDPPVIDKSYSWGYFDGASKGNPGSCGAGGVLFISESLCYLSWFLWCWGCLIHF